MTLLAAISLAPVAVGCVIGAHRLAVAGWPAHSPRLAIALWQALGLTAGVAAIGALVGFAVVPYDAGVGGGVAALVRDGVVTAGLAPWQIVVLAAAGLLAVLLVGALGAALVQVTRVRWRQRRLLALVAGRSERAPGVLLIDHPVAAAYCVPGVRSRIVVSAGTVDLLSAAELDAVLAHEQAHASERHDLVLLPFTSLHIAFPFAGLVRRAAAAVGLLVEMAADDRARKSAPARELATALARVGVGGSHVPVGALGVTGAAEYPGAPVSARVARLLEPRPLGRWQQALVAVVTAVPPAITVLLLQL